MAKPKLSPSPSSHKKAIIVAAVLLGILPIIFVTLICVDKYAQWRTARRVAAYEQEQERPYREDMYGGKTPKETLDLFIAALQKEDFVLASKYIVLSKQEEWKEGFKKAKEKGNLEWLLINLKKMENRGNLGPSTFQMGARDEEGVFLTFITFVKYPSGVWKIQDL